MSLASAKVAILIKIGYTKISSINHTEKNSIPELIFDLGFHVVFFLVKNSENKKKISIFISVVIEFLYLYLSYPNSNLSIFTSYYLQKNILLIFFYRFQHIYTALKCKKKLKLKKKINSFPVNFITQKNEKILYLLIFLELFIYV